MLNPNLIFYNIADRFKNQIVPATSVHSCYELVYFIKTDNQLKLNDNMYSLYDGSIYLVYPYSLHEELHRADGKVIYLGFDCENFPRGILPETVYELPNHAEICDIMKKIVKEAASQKEYYSELISHLLGEILLLLQRSLSGNAQSVKSIEYAYNFIAEHYSQQIDFAQLARLSGYSPDRFRHIFTQKKGMSPKQFQINMRLEKSAELLADKHASCTQIAQACGFSTSAQFSNMFRHKYGISPKQFQNRN